MELIKVKRSAYTKLRQSQIPNYVHNVVSRTFENPTYADIAPQVLDLKEKVTAYDAALLAAAEGGKGLVFLKNKAKREVIISMDYLANVAEVFCKGEESYIVGMGLEVQQLKKKTRTVTERPEMPTQILAQSTGKVGELEISFNLPNKTQVKMVAVEERIANSGQPFTNGRYMDKDKMVLTGFPQLQMVELRFNALGHDSLKSGWTASIVVPVL